MMEGREKNISAAIKIRAMKKTKDEWGEQREQGHVSCQNR
jgi:hypothetical protein